MKRILALVGILVVCGAALYFAQRQKRPDGVSANAVLDMAADLQRDVTTVPMHMTRIPDDQEIRIGNELAGEYGSPAVPDDPELKATEKYVNEVGQRVAAHAQRKIPFHFHLVPDASLINAFALPGGQIFVGQGLLDQMTSEDELAFVLGHETEHIDHYHSAERVQVEAHLKNMHLNVVSEITQLPISLWQVGYSKEEELEADREGLRLAVAAGYSPKGAMNLMERWTKLRDEYVSHASTPQQELSQVAVDGLTGYFRTHPVPSERLVQVKDVIGQDHLNANQATRPFHVEYEVTTVHR